MKRLFFITATLVVFGLLETGCEGSHDQKTEMNTDSVASEDKTEVVEPPVVEEGDTITFPEKSGIRLYALDSLPEFMDAQLTQSIPADRAKLQTGEIKFKFDVKNYELGDQTGEGCGNCANSSKGQHIHLILNNNPYIALYNPDYKKEMEEGHYVELAFLSRSYHISLKNPEAYVLRQFTVGNPEEVKNFDETAAHLFYSRPKGEYKGPDAEKVILDFYIVNTGLSANGNKVRAYINNIPFTITKWVPYVIEGLKEGKNTIKLELIDQEGNLVSSPFNPVERTITISKNIQ